VLEKIKQIIAEQERAPLPVQVSMLRRLLEKLPTLNRKRKGSAIEGIGKYGDPINVR
jgi:hypothetical protein